MTFHQRRFSNQSILSWSMAREGVLQDLLVTHQSTRSKRASVDSDVVRSVGLSRRRPIGFWRAATGEGATIRRVIVVSVGGALDGGHILNQVSCLVTFHSRNGYDLSKEEKPCFCSSPARSALVFNEDKTRHGRVRLVPCSHCTKDAVEVQVESARDSFCLSADWNCWSGFLDHHSSDDSLYESLGPPAELLGKPRGLTMTGVGCRCSSCVEPFICSAYPELFFSVSDG